MNPYFNKMKSKHIFIFLSACFILRFVLFFSMINILVSSLLKKKEKKMNPYFKKMKSKHILIFLFDCILLLICLIHFAFLT